LLVNEAKGGRVKITTKVQALGTAKVSLVHGGAGSLRLTLTKAGKKLLNNKHRLTATFTLTLTSSAGRRTASDRLALIAPPRH
jgi:hypothetical protein